MTDLYTKAANIMRAVPDQIHFTRSMALACCGADLDLAQSPEAIQKLQHVLDWRAQQWGAPLFSNEDNEIATRAETIIYNAVKVPNWKKVILFQRSHRSAIPLADAMPRSGQPLKNADALRLAGAREDQVGPGKLAVRIGRFVKKLEQKKQAACMSSGAPLPERNAMVPPSSSLIYCDKENASPKMIPSSAPPLPKRIVTTPSLSYTEIVVSQCLIHM